MVKSNAVTLEIVSKILEIAVNMLGRAYSTKEIAEEFNITVRTAQRYIKAMTVPLGVYEDSSSSDGRSKRYRVKGTNALRFTNIAFEDLQVLEIATKLLERSQKKDDVQKLKKIKGIIAGVIHNKIDDIDYENIEVERQSEMFIRNVRIKFKIDYDMINMIKRAICNKKQLAFKYKPKHNISSDSSDSRVSRVIIPIGCLYGERNNYLIARYNDNEDSVRSFILDRITDMKELNKSFKSNSKFTLENYSKNLFGAFNEKPQKIIWKFSKNVAEDAMRCTFHNSQKSKLDKEGNLIVEFFAGGLLEMSWHLAIWGDNVEVIAPKNFWKVVNNRLI